MGDVLAVLIRLLNVGAETATSSLSRVESPGRGMDAAK